MAENRTVCRCLRRLVEDRLEVLGEAHVEHLVGLVEDDGGDLAQPQAAPVQQVQRPAGGRDDDVDAGLQRPQLADDRGAAVDREHPGAEVAAVAVQGLRHLDGELAGGHEDEADRCALGAVRGEHLEDRQGEGRGLAGAGGGLAEQVAPGHQRRDRLLLDRRGLLVAEAGQRLQQLRPQPEVVEGGALLVVVHRAHRSPNAPAARRRGRGRLTA